MVYSFIKKNFCIKMNSLQIYRKYSALIWITVNIQGQGITEAAGRINRRGRMVKTITCKWMDTDLASEEV